MYQIMSLQSAKIRRLEDRVLQLESMLPDAAEFATDGDHDPVDEFGQTSGGKFHPRSTWNTWIAQDSLSLTHTHTQWNKAANKSAAEDKSAAQAQ